MPGVPSSGCGRPGGGNKGPQCPDSRIVAPLRPSQVAPVARGGGPLPGHSGADRAGFPPASWRTPCIRITVHRRRTRPPDQPTTTPTRPAPLESALLATPARHFRDGGIPIRSRSGGAGTISPPRARRCAQAARTHVQAGIAPNGWAVPGSMEKREQQEVLAEGGALQHTLGPEQTQAVSGPMRGRQKRVAPRSAGAGRMPGSTPRRSRRSVHRRHSSTLNFDAGSVAARTTAVKPANSADHAWRRGSRRMSMCGMPSSRYSSPSSTKPKER